jgi:hypothetical protein
MTQRWSTMLSNRWTCPRRHAIVALRAWLRGRATTPLALN